MSKALAEQFAQATNVTKIGLDAQKAVVRLTKDNGVMSSFNPLKEITDAVKSVNSVNAIGENISHCRFCRTDFFVVTN